MSRVAPQIAPSPATYITSHTSTRHRPNFLRLSGLTASQGDETDISQPLHLKHISISHDSRPQPTRAEFVTCLATMSGRLITAKLQPLAQRASAGGARHLHHRSYSSAGGLLRSDAAVRSARRRIWPTGYTPFSNAVAVRNASFMRIIPQILIKFARIPALFGGATIAGLAYIQYQAARRLCVVFIE